MIFNKVIDLKKPQGISVNPPFSKKTKGAIDEKVSDYHPSSYWDHMFTIFYERSVAQTHAEAVKEWQLIGYEYVPEGGKCGFHDNATKHFYILKNTVRPFYTDENGSVRENIFKVGADCAASHTLPETYSTKGYSEDSWAEMKQRCKDMRVKMIKKRTRKFLETHGLLIEDALDTLIKYRGLLKAEGLNKELAVIRKLIKNYRSSRAAAEGEREHMIYWHDQEMKKIEGYLSMLYATIPALRVHKGFERKMRALWNYRELLTPEEQKFIEEQHILWDRDLADHNDTFCISSENVVLLMRLYSTLLAEYGLIEIDPIKDGQFRLTIRMLDSYKHFLTKDMTALLMMTQDASRLLRLRTPEHIDEMIRTLTIVIKDNPHNVDMFTRGEHFTKFIKMVKGLWEGTGIIPKPVQDTLIEELALIRANKATHGDILSTRPDIIERLRLLKLYGTLLGKDAFELHIRPLITAWERYRFNMKGVTAVDQYFEQLVVKKLKLSSYPKHTGTDPRWAFTLLTKTQRFFHKEKFGLVRATDQVPALAEKYKALAPELIGWDDADHKYSPIEVEKALQLAVEVSKDLPILLEHFAFKEDIKDTDPQLFSQLEYLYNYYEYREPEPTLQQAQFKIKTAWLQGYFCKEYQAEIQALFIDPAQQCGAGMTVADLIVQLEALPRTTKLAMIIRDFIRYGCVPALFMEYLLAYHQNTLFRELALCQEYFSGVMKEENKYDPLTALKELLQFTENYDIVAEHLFNEIIKIPRGYDIYTRTRALDKQLTLANILRPAFQAKAITALLEALIADFTSYAQTYQRPQIAPLILRIYSDPRFELSQDDRLKIAATFIRTEYSDQIDATLIREIEDREKKAEDTWTNSRRAELEERLTGNDMLWNARYETLRKAIIALEQYYPLVQHDPEKLRLALEILASGLGCLWTLSYGRKSGPRIFDRIKTLYGDALHEHSGIAAEVLRARIQKPMIHNEGKDIKYQKDVNFGILVVLQYYCHQHSPLSDADKQLVDTLLERYARSKPDNLTGKNHEGALTIIKSIRAALGNG